MDDAERAYTAAEEEIKRALKWSATRLELNAEPFHALDRLPPEIAALTQLVSLDLDKTKLTDLTPLRGLSALEALYLNSTPVTDLKPLQGLTALQGIMLMNAPVTDLTPLQGLSALEALSLDNTQVSDLAPLHGLSALQGLYLDNTQVTDLSPLQGLYALQTLSLKNTQVTDLRPIADLAELGEDRFGVLRFKGTPAARATPELTRLSQIEENEQRTRETLAYLRTLPPWPAPLPWEETRAAGSPRPHAQTAGAAGQTPAEPAPPPHGLPHLITAGRARQVLETHATDLRGQCQFVTDQINQTLAQQIPTKPNDPEALAEWTHLVNTLELSRAAIVSLHEAIPERAEERPVTENEANRLKHAFETAIATLQQASTYIDGPAEAHGRTYAGLLKIGVCTALAAPIALISAQSVALIGGGLYAMLYGKGAALDVVKAIGGTPGPKSGDTP